MIAGFDVGDVLANRLDHGRAFMAEYGWRGIRIQPFHEMQVGMTQAGERGAQKNFPTFRFFNLDLLDRQRLVRHVEDRGFHIWFLRLGPTD